MKAALRLAPLLAASLALPACVSAPAAPAPAPAPVVRPTPAPSPTPVPKSPVSSNWMDNAATPGAWRMFAEPGETIALFGNPSPAHPFLIRCDTTTRQIGLARATVRSGPLQMRIVTETTFRVFIATKVEGYPMVAAILDPRDPLLDAMALSKGRFAVEVEGEAPLYLPSYAEVSRVIEDCR